MEYSSTAPLIAFDRLNASSVFASAVFHLTVLTCRPHVSSQRLAAVRPITSLTRRTPHFPTDLTALLAECDEDWMAGKIYLNLQA